MTDEYLEVEMESVNKEEEEDVELKDNMKKEEEENKITKLGQEPTQEEPQEEGEIKKKETNNSFMAGTKLAIFQDPLYLKAENRRDKVVFSMVVFLKQILAAIGSKSEEVNSSTH
jgi:hypothetical protein